MVEDKPSFYMHCESQGLDSVLLSELIQNDNLVGETDMNNNFSLPHASSNENHIFERGKCFC